MAAKLIPEYGSHFLPGVKHQMKVSIGYNSDYDVPMAAAGAYTLFTPSVGILVTDMRVVKETAFGSTGAFTFTIGDTDVDGFALSSELVMSDTGQKSMRGVKSTANDLLDAAAYYAGRLYTSDDTLAITATIGTAPINAGKAYVIVEYLDLNEF